MITKFKIFENNSDYMEVIYMCADFTVRKDFTFESMFLGSDIIRVLPTLIIEKHFALNDEKFRNLEITIKYKKSFSMHTISLYDKKIENIKNYKSGLISNFLYKHKKEDLEEINPESYIQLVFKYYPIIEKIITDADTIDDVIIEYEKLIPEINKDLIFFTTIQKYNL